ncbi:unnamed protein product [Paramecium sonneborni]|uniref:DNA-directed RNA polymerase III subunit RPC3 n=1 Tax=Paramecium sonneborni TaxID=65129 RepID=A0A8S1MKW5_9CILI|nr:unnamed protein product [Paramecium sonneborni]
MNTFRTLYFSQLAQQHFGEAMGKVVNVLDQYGPIQYQDILKYTRFDDLKFLEIVITLGIKHQIIGFKFKTQQDNGIELKKSSDKDKSQDDPNQKKKKIKKKGLIFVNHIALLGREYVPELLSIEKKYNIIIDYALKKGVFGIQNLISDNIKENDLEILVNELFDKSLLQIVQIEQPDQHEEVKETIHKDTKNKSEKKTQKANKKIEILSQKQQSVTQNSLLQINWTGLIDTVKNNAIMEQLRQIYGISNFQDQTIYLQKQKELKENLEIKWVEDKFSLKHSRIFNLLRMKNCPLDEKQICDFALMNFKDSNAILFELLKEQLIKTQILKVNDKDKQIYLYDQKLVDAKLQLYFYKGLISCKDKQLYFGILNQWNLMQFEVKN